MGLTYQMKMKIPFDMADMNGHIKLPDVILLSLQVSGMQSIELGVSDKPFWKTIIWSGLSQNMILRWFVCLVLRKKLPLKRKP